MWPVCQAWGARGSRPRPRAGGDRLRGRRPAASPGGCSSSLSCPEAEMPEESKTRPREGGRKKGHLRRDACRVGPASPAPCSGRVSLPPPVSLEAIRSKGGPEGISRYTCGSHFSETQHGGSRSEAWGQGGEARKGQAGPLQAGPGAGLEAVSCCCGSGRGGHLLPHRETSGLLQAAGGWGANEAGSVLLVGCLGTMSTAGRRRAGRGGASPGPRGAGFQGRGRCGICSAEEAVESA